MPTISDNTIRAIYDLCGDPRCPVEEYCIGCGNCEYYGFPCANCAMYVFGDQLGPGEGYDTVDEGDVDMEDAEAPITPRISEEESCEIPSTWCTYEEFCNWADEDMMSREAQYEPASPTHSEESVTSPSYIDLLSFTKN